MIKAAIDRILGLAAVEKFSIDGRTFTSKNLAEVVPPSPDSMKINTLTGFADYINKNPDRLRYEGLLAHVIDPENVVLRSSIEPVHQARSTYLSANHSPASFPFGQYLQVENFIISLQTYFVSSPTVADMIRLVGNLTVGASVKHLDDGISQEVTAKTGITRVENVVVPNPVLLAPYRTFLEITQPESPFVFRIKQDKDGAPTCALFSADGGNWKLEAIAGIKQWLETELPKNFTILA